MLGQREDLRDRFIRLIGAGQCDDDDAAHGRGGASGQPVPGVADADQHRCSARWSRCGLYWIGVPYAALWGGITAVLRFVPYVGTLLSALMPATLAFATFPGLDRDTADAGAVPDAGSASPRTSSSRVVFGQRTGVSSFALLISALFWIWVWGPVGLLLATPLTVCIAVLGRHVRSLRFLAIIFADEPALHAACSLLSATAGARRERSDGRWSIASVQRARRGRRDGSRAASPRVTLVLAASLAERDHRGGRRSSSWTRLPKSCSRWCAENADAAPGAPRIIGLAAHAEVDHVVLEMLRTAVAPLAMDAGSGRAARG